MTFRPTNIIGVLRIASYFGLDSLIEQVKKILSSDRFKAIDLCPLYKEVQDRDFDGMKQFLTDNIPKKANSMQICRIIKEIWTDYEDDIKDIITEESEEGPESEGEESEKKKKCDTRSEIDYNYRP